MLSKLNVGLGCYCQKDAFPLTRCLRLHNECSLFILCFNEKAPELRSIRRKHPGFWVEEEILRKHLRHCIKCLSKLVFAREDSHPRKMVHSLIRLKAKQAVRTWCSITPVDVEVVWKPSLPWQNRDWMLFFNDLHFEILLCDVSYDLILAMVDVDV